MRIGNLKSQNGAALLLTLVLLTSLLVTIFVLATIAQMNLRATGETDDSMYAFYAAEASVETALQDIAWSMRRGENVDIESYRMRPGDERFLPSGSYFLRAMSNATHAGQKKIIRANETDQLALIDPGDEQNPLVEDNWNEIVTPYNLDMVEVNARDIGDRPEDAILEITTYCWIKPGLYDTRSLKMDKVLVDLNDLDFTDHRISLMCGYSDSANYIFRFRALFDDVKYYIRTGSTNFLDGRMPAIEIRATGFYKDSSRAVKVSMPPIAEAEDIADFALFVDSGIYKIAPGPLTVGDPPSFDKFRRVLTGTTQPPAGWPCVWGENSSWQGRIFDVHGSLQKYFYRSCPGFPTQPTFVAAGDIDGDREDEIIHTYGWIIGIKDPPNFDSYKCTMSGGPIGPMYEARVATGDTDGDGDHEIIVVYKDTSGEPGKLTYIYDEDCNLLDSWPINSPRYGHYVASGDIDSDGIDEVILGEGEPNVLGRTYVQMYEPDGSWIGQFDPWPSSPTRELRVASGDTNSNGKADIIVARPAGVSVVNRRVLILEWDPWVSVGWFEIAGGNTAGYFVDSYNIDTSTSEDEVLVSTENDGCPVCANEVRIYQRHPTCPWCQLQKIHDFPPYSDDYAGGTTVSAGYFGF